MKDFIKNILLFLIVPVIFFLFSAASYSWNPDQKPRGPHFNLLKFRAELPHPDYYDAPPEVKSVQQHQVRHKDLGFLWRPGISEADEVIIKWGDIPAGALTTGVYGYSNSKDAIDDFASGEKPSIIGVGASFMGGAHNLFYDYFGFEGEFYYNMSHGRYTLPQYNISMEKYALALKPRWIIYGMNESSHLLIDDFEGWRKSGLDWFEYHCGSWAGPARKEGPIYDKLRGSAWVFSYVNALHKKVWPAKPASTVKGKKRQIKKSMDYIRQAYQLARQNGSFFVVMLIPSKARMLGNNSKEHYLLERLVPELSKERIPFIDLRVPFKAAENPAELYFHYDAHWNRQGVYIAAREFLKHKKKLEAQNNS